MDDQWKDGLNGDWSRIRQKENLRSGLNLDDLPRNGCHIPATHKTLQKFFSEKSFEERL